MSWLARCRSLLGNALGRRRMESDMDSEMRFHLASYTEDLVRSGVSREQAERQARIEFGHLEPLKEDCRQARGLRILDETIQDLRFGARMLRKSPGFAAVAVLTLTVGIGANTSIFSLVNDWILKPLPYPDPDRLVTIQTLDVKHGRTGGASAPELSDWRDQAKVFTDICAWMSPAVTFMHGDEPERIDGARVSPEFFRMLGVSPQLGRDFMSADDRPGANRVAIISNNFWRTRFAGDRNLLGKSMQIDGEAVTVVGILPANFHLPLMGKASIWMPLRLTDQERTDRRLRFVSVMARIKPGVDLAHASGVMKTIARRLETTYPATNANRGVQLQTLSQVIGKQGGNEQALIVFWLVECVLLIACVNVANLIVGRAVGRQREMAIRLAIGAGRTRLLRQLLTENLMLFLLAAGLSVLFAIWGVNWIAQSIPYEVRSYLPNSGALSVDRTTLLYTLAVAVVTGLLFGFAPAIHCWRVNVNDRLKSETARVSASNASTRLKNCLVVFEVSLALVVLVASGLLIKGLMRMYTADLGFNPKALSTAEIVLSTAKYSDVKRAEAFFSGVLEQIRALPAVKAAGAALLVPYSRNNTTIRYGIDGQPSSAPGDLAVVRFNIATPEYFRAMEIPLLRGRVFFEQDNSESLPVAIINETMARRHWSGENPIGKRIRYGANLGRTVTIVGVVKDTKGQDETDIPEAELYLPHRQYSVRVMRLVIQTDSREIAADIRRAVRTVDKAQAVAQIQTMDELMLNVRAPFIIVGQVTTFFAAISLFLAALGIYGVMAYSVTARIQEFGIRMALGAARRTLVAQVVHQGLKLALIGLGIGLMSALAVTRFMSAILYQVSPTDKVTFAAITLLLLAVAMIACYFPARKASSVDPTIALRYE